MSIKQLNATYLLQEDRILFRINTEERADFQQKNLASSQLIGPEFEAGETFPPGNATILVLDVTCSIAEADASYEQ
jgi:hypothetical protein